MQPVVTVVIVNFNAGSHLSATLRGLAAQSEPHFRAIIVDNASSDNSIADARACVVGDIRFEFILLTENTGFAAANNLAARRTETDWLALLNPDATPAPNWLEKLLSGAAYHPEVGMFGCTQIAANDHTRLDGAGDQYLAAGLPWRGGYGWPRTALHRANHAFTPCAAAALYRAQDFRDVGGFDESFFCYVEDVDLGFRMRLRGHGAMQIDDAIVFHVGGGSGGRHSDFARYHGVRNIVWCFVKNMPDALFWPLLPLHVAMLAAYGIMATLRGHGALFLRSMRDAVCGLPAAWRQRKAIQTARTVDWREIAKALSWNPLACLQRRPL